MVLGKVERLKHKPGEMRPTITFQCDNERCSEHGKTVSIEHYSWLGFNSDNEKAQADLAKFPYCPKCHSKGSLSIEHGSRFFSNLDAFEEYLVGLTEQAKLLKRLVDSKIATDEENERYSEVLELIAEVKCTCCGRPLDKLIE